MDRPRLSRFLDLGVILLLAGSLLAYLADRTPEMHKGVWIWETKGMLSGGDLFARFEQMGVTHIYLYVDRKQAAPKDFASLIREAARRDMKVEALAGDPTWGWERNRSHLRKFIEWVAGYNRNVAEEERFSGIHLDIEPYLLPEWWTDREALVEEWLSNLEFAAAYARWLDQLPVAVDLPFWVHLIEVPGYEDLDVGTWMLTRFDTVVLMDYRDFAEGEDGIIANARSMVEAAASMGKSVIVGVDAAPSAEGEKTTFFEEGFQFMEQELDIAREALSKSAGFRGIAIHGFPYLFREEGKPEQGR